MLYNSNRIINLFREMERERESGRDITSIGEKDREGSESI